jgi:sucrose-6-phosphate hydrolase SacC (GH32 family)
MDFRKEYQSRMSRLGVFRTSEEFEVQKTVAAIDTLLRRADDLYRGSRPDYCYGIDAENLMARAEAHLSALERGERPLAGRFTEPGVAFVDHCFIEHEGVMHVFYNRSWVGYDWPERYTDTIGHATSTDLIHWRIHTPVLAVSPDDFGTYQVWSPAVIEDGGRFYMLYTGVNENVAQAACLAVSDDLYHFKKYENNPVYVPGAWSGWDAGRWSDCRDSFCLKHDGVFYQYVYVSLPQADGPNAPATGILSSTDMIHWKEEGTVRMPACTHAAESPFVVHHGESWYLFYTNCGKGTCYATGPSPLGPWEEQGLLFGARTNSPDPAHVPSCAEVFCYKDNWYISVCERLPGWEQYLEIYELFWQPDGSVRVGELLR